MQETIPERRRQPCCGPAAVLSRSEVMGLVSICTSTTGGFVRIVIARRTKVCSDMNCTKKDMKRDIQIKLRAMYSRYAPLRLIKSLTSWNYIIWVIWYNYRAIAMPRLPQIVARHPTSAWTLWRSPPHIVTLASQTILPLSPISIYPSNILVS